MDKKSGGIIGIIAICVIGGALALFSKILPHLFKIVLWVGLGIIGLVVVLMLVGIFFALKNSKSDAKADAAKRKLGEAGLDDDQAEMLASARSKLMDLRREIMGVKDTKIHTRANETCGVIDKIIQTLKQKPDKIDNTRQCLNYYIPTFTEVIEKYKRLESSGVNTDDTKQKVLTYVEDIKTAMEKQYKNLFADDILDMTVDMEAMKMAFKRDGLISDTNMEVGEGDRKINLTL